MFQSGFKAKHTTETARVNISNDLLMAAHRGHVSIDLLPDLTGTFDTVCHNLLLTRVQTPLGITGITLSCEISAFCLLSLALDLPTLPFLGASLRDLF